MFGDESDHIPWCAGYAVGYWVVQNYLKKGISLVRLVEVKPEDMIEHERGERCEKMDKEIGNR